MISDDITKITPRQILSLRVLKTFIGGKIVYEESSGQSGISAQR